MTFEQIIAKLFGSVYNLYETFGWYGLGIAGATCLLTIPFNLIVKAIFKKIKNTQITRLRKAFSTCLPFGVGIGVLYAYEWLIGEHVYDFSEIIKHVWDTGLSAMVIWFAIKFVKDVGFGGLVDFVNNNAQCKELLKKLDIDKKVSSQVLDAVTQLVKFNAKSENISVEEYFTAHINDISGKVNATLKDYGVDKETAVKCVGTLVEAVKSKLKVKEK